MGIKVLDPVEGVVCLHKTRDPAEEGPLPGRIVRAYRDVFSHGLPDIEVLLAVRAGEKSHLLQACQPPWATL